MTFHIRSSTQFGLFYGAGNGAAHPNQMFTGRYTFSIGSPTLAIAACGAMLIISCGPTAR